MVPLRLLLVTQKVVTLL